MNIDDFVTNESSALIGKISAYLAQDITHSEISSYVDNVFEIWDKLNLDISEPYSKGEKELWCSLWSTQHLASEDHWRDGVTQRDLGFLLKVLKCEEKLPSSFEGRRP